MRNNENELDFNELIQEDKEGNKSEDKQLPQHQKSAYKPIRFYHNGRERGLTLMMNIIQDKEKIHDALKQIRVQSIHGYNLNNAKSALNRLIQNGRIEVVDRIKPNKVQGSYPKWKAVIDINLKFQSNCVRLQFDAIGQSSDDAEKRCILNLITKLYSYDLIKEAAIELYCPNRKILDDPVRKIDKKQKAWLDSKAETFIKKLDEIYFDEEVIIAKMKAIDKDCKLIHQDNGKQSQNVFNVRNGFYDDNKTGADNDIDDWCVDE